MLLVPLLVILSYFFTPSSDAWKHLVEYRLLDYFINTALLAFFVGFLSLIFGTLSAYLTTSYKFFMSKTLEWALVLPLAFPAYITAYMYEGITGIGGYLTKALHELFGFSYSSLQVIGVLSFQGAAFVMFAALYPYVYLSAKAALRQQSSSLIEVGRINGYSEMKIFFKIILPLIRPALVIGVSLAVMETISDFGVVDYCGINTFVVGIFRAWEGMGDLEAASKLASMLMTFVLVLFFVEKWQRKEARYSNDSKSFKPIIAKETTLFQNIVMFILCAFPFVVGFLLPSIQLIKWFFMSLELVDKAFFIATLNTAFVSMVAALITTVVGLTLAYALKLKPGNVSQTSLNLSKLGYSVPGAIVAVGILVVFGFIDRSYASLTNSTDLLVGGTILALIYGYCVRFLSVSAGNIESGISKISENYSEAAKTMGHSKFAIFKKIDLPLLKGSIGVSVVIVLIEVLKELPLTLILRPFNFETLATYTYELTFQEMLVESSVPALSIVLLALVPVIILIKTTIKE